MVWENILATILIWIIIIILSALPLHLAVKLLGGKTNLMKTILVLFLTGVLTSIIIAIFPFGALISLVFLIWIYHEIFRLKWLKAFLAWILQIIFILILIFILGAIGLSFIAADFFFDFNFF